MTSANNNNYASMSFWDFVHSLDPNSATGPGVGVDHVQPGPRFPPGFPFHNFSHWGPWEGRGGHSGRRGGWDGPWGGRFRGWHDNNDNLAPEGGDNDGEDGSDTPSGPPPPPPPGPPGSGHPFPHPRGFGRRGGRGRGGLCGRGFPRGRYRGSPSCQGAWDFRPMMHTFSHHPFVQALRPYLEQVQVEEDEAFTPPVDIFNRSSEWQIHVALPGAKKEDVGVSWDSDKKTLNIAGVVYRPGDEEFLQSLSTSERKVGMFDRIVKLPPEGSDDKDEVDDDSISARIEDGVLIITVPKVEREWTEIKKVDVE